ncbi:P-loop containing nucleoside triphosphate hydrolase protein [Mycena vulgaris]|nr:P-loop containing nucleoside triphosphate hydrolase protein [Mycena vulgaris]
MHGLGLSRSLWARCRPCVAPTQWLGHRFRGQVTTKNKKNVKYSKEAAMGHARPHPRGGPPRVAPEVGGVSVNVSPHGILTYFRANVDGWSKRRAVLDLLVSFGAPSADAHKLLAAFARDAAHGVFDSPDAMQMYALPRLGGTDAIEADIAFSNIFFRWLTVRAQPVPGVNASSVMLLQRLAEAAGGQPPAEDHLQTRTTRRKVIMHVGPTNSGKTHHALRALAAARCGVYAGPLRLLAYEIWERLNMGLITPLGASPADVAAAAAMGPSPDSPLARMCDMVTGEEQKIVLPEDMPGLMSCTIEMLPLVARYDVAVVDEIQMISDRERGWGWTRAVLGISAAELHLCGEETAVPLVEKLLKETDDELIVRRYERLTPLEVEPVSLDGDLSLVRKGDCIVTFSRTSIFALKRRVEKQTGMKCAVVYGKLPPEIRSEQAALFNDPDSGYDVLIGSDAIGMGLNLKIRRIIFESVEKWDGGAGGFKTLSVSQMKQIAGRAGRFGLHAAGETPGGFVTTLKPEHLPVLRRTLPIALPPLPHARVQPTTIAVLQLCGHLPDGASLETVFAAVLHAGTLAPHYRYAFPDQLAAIARFLDSMGRFTLEDRLTFLQAPFPWRDVQALEAVRVFVSRYYETMDVDIGPALQELPYLGLLERAEDAMRAEAGGPPVEGKFDAAKELMQLEVFHKILVVYMWLAYRNPVSYSGYDAATALKERLERVLHWCLQDMTFQRGERAEHVKLKRTPIQFKSERQLRLEQQAQLKLEPASRAV